MAMLLDDIKWVVTRVDGRIAAVSPDWSGLRRTASILDDSAGRYSPHKKFSPASVTVEVLTMSELQALNSALTLDDLLLLGTAFQQDVWSHLFGLTHPVQRAPGIFSYSDFAAICGRSASLRAVSHAVGLNPVSYVVPCHLVVPIDTVRRIEAAYEAAIDTIFEGRDLYVFDAFDMGEYSYGKRLKSQLIALDLNK